MGASQCAEIDDRGCRKARNRLINSPSPSGFAFVTASKQSLRPKADPAGGGPLRSALDWPPPDQDSCRQSPMAAGSKAPTQAGSRHRSQLAAAPDTTGTSSTPKRSIAPRRSADCIP